MKDADPKRPKNDGQQKKALWARAKASGLSRRTFLALLAAGGVGAVIAACGQDPTASPTSTPTPRPTATPVPLAVAQVPLPPVTAKVVPTACDYCIVGCAYKVYTWPVGQDGGATAAENAMGVDFPAQVLSGQWISPNMHNIVQINGASHNVLVLPDSDATVVNVRGDHSIRGGLWPRSSISQTSRPKTGSRHPSFGSMGFQCQ